MLSDLFVLFFLGFCRVENLTDGEKMSLIEGLTDGEVKVGKTRREKGGEIFLRRGNCGKKGHGERNGDFADENTDGHIHWICRTSYQSGGASGCKKE